MNPPIFSLVTPSFNQAVFLERTICSVLDQDYPRLEYLIMDAGSTDGSLEIIKRHASRLAHWQSAKDNGPASALNEGFRRTTGEILAYLNSDDCYLPGALEVAVETFARYPEVDIVYGDIDFIDAVGNPTHMPGRHVRRFKAIPFNRRYMASGCLVIPQQASFWRRHVFERLGGFVESNATCWDGEFFADAALAGMRFHHVPRVLAQFRIHETSISVTSHVDSVARSSRFATHYQIDQGNIRAKWAAAGFRPSNLERAYCRIASGLKRAVRYALP